MQLESAHFMRTGDEVRHADGRSGRVVQSLTLWAVVAWEEGGEQEVEQLDPRVTVTERATRE